jgi:non-specific serine/threonine protein kinase
MPDQALVLEGLWHGLNDTFSRDIKNFKGPVSDYFRENSDLPFVFMATYSAGMGANGKPKHLSLIACMPLKRCSNDRQKAI